MQVVIHLYCSIKQFINHGIKIKAVSFIRRGATAKRKGHAAVTTGGTGVAAANATTRVDYLQNEFFSATNFAVKLINECRVKQSTVETLLTLMERTAAAK